MHVTFNPQTIDWAAFVQPNSPEDFQYGFGSSQSDYAVFQGLPSQRGAGIGSIFRSLLRYIMPLGRQAGIALGREGIDTSQRILDQVIKGGNVKQADLAEGRDGLKNIMERAAQKLGKQSGEGQVGKYKKNSLPHKFPPLPKGKKSAHSYPTTNTKYKFHSATGAAKTVS